MKKQKQMLSASINDDEEEDIFPSNNDNLINEEDNENNLNEFTNKKREREEQIEGKLKKSKFEPVSNEPKPTNVPIINNVINTNVVINPPLKSINVTQPTYPYYNSNLHTATKMPYNYYQNTSHYGMNPTGIKSIKLGYYQGIPQNNNIGYNFNYNYHQNNLANHAYGAQFNNGSFLHGQNPAAVSFIQQNQPKYLYNLN